MGTLPQIICFGSIHIGINITCNKSDSPVPSILPQEDFSAYKGPFLHMLLPIHPIPGHIISGTHPDDRRYCGMVLTPSGITLPCFSFDLINKVNQKQKCLTPQNSVPEFSVSLWFKHEKCIHSWREISYVLPLNLRFLVL